jgi:predicted protein tyrosine phosphatase
MIVGREIPKELGILLNFKDETIEWDDVIFSMKPASVKVDKNMITSQIAFKLMMQLNIPNPFLMQNKNLLIYRRLLVTAVVFPHMSNTRYM